MSKSIRYYYFTSIATVLVASVLVMGLIQTYLASTYFGREKEMLLDQLVVSVAEGTKRGEIRLTDDSRHIIDYMANIAGAGVFISNENGLIVYCTEESNMLLGQEISDTVLKAIAASGTFWELGRLGGLYDRNYYSVATSIDGASAYLNGYIFASSDATGLKIYLNEMMSSFILSAGLVMLIASVLALILTNRTVIPIRRVSAAAKKFGEGDYSGRVPVEGDDELAQLAITFNEMANSFEATDSSRRSFMGNIAHELRTPMTTIKGFIDGMLDGTIPEDQRDKYLMIVSEEVGRLARLTKNMLDISKLEAGEYRPNFAIFDIWGPITSVFLGSEQRLEEKQVSVEGLVADKPVTVIGDEDYVHQILFNIVDNAIKFADEGGTITVTVSAAKGVVTVSIRNTGAGVPSDVLPYIFDRFYKEDRSRGLNVGGSGLGLHICKVLLGLMSGRIWADSEEGAWTEFHFTLPIASQKKTRNENKKGGDL